MIIKEDNNWILTEKETEIINNIRNIAIKYRDSILKLKLVEKTYLYLTGVGLTISLDEKLGLDIKNWDEIIEDAEKAKEFILRTSISIFDDFPECFTNRIFYPRAFRLRYSKACFREEVIKEYERFLPEVLSVKNGDYNYLFLAYTEKLDEHTLQFNNEIITNQQPEYKISAFLMDLGEMYLSEYRYDDVRTIFEWHRSKKISSFAYNLAPQYFRRTNTFDQGRKYFEECLKEFPQKDERIFKQAIGWMNLWPNLKPYKGRPRKKESFSNEITKLPEGKERI